MTVEIIEALGIYIVMPIAFVVWIYLICKL